MCGKISVLAARGLQTCDAQALTTDCAEGSRTGGSETHRYGPTSFRNLYIQPHARTITKTLPIACRRPLQRQNIPYIIPGYPHKALFRIGQFSSPVVFNRSIWHFSSHVQALRCKSPGTHVLKFLNLHTCNTRKFQLIQVFEVTTGNGVANVVCVKKDICFLARTYISRRRNT